MEQNVEKGISWLQRILNLQKKYGFFSIIKGLFLLFVTGYVIFFALNPRFLFERLTAIQTEQHDHAVQSRIAADAKIHLILSKTLASTDADRAWLIEFHNGSKNLTTGLPFLFGSMRIEETRQGVMNIDEDYSDFSLSKYRLFAQTLEDGFYYGNVEDVQHIDQRLYYKFKSNDLNEIALLTLYSGDKPVGIVGLSFCHNKSMNRQLVGRYIRSCGMQISALLSQIKQ